MIMGVLLTTLLTCSRPTSRWFIGQCLPVQPDQRGDHSQLLYSECSLPVCWPEGHAGKVGYLAEQFVAHGLLLGGLQETRTPEGCLRSGQVQTFCSGSVKGFGGLELWINLQQPYGYEGRRPRFLRPHHCQVLLAEPSRLITHLCMLSILFRSAARYRREKLPRAQE